MVQSYLWITSPELSLNHIARAIFESHCLCTGLIHVFCFGVIYKQPFLSVCQINFIRKRHVLKPDAVHMVVHTYSLLTNGMVHQVVGNVIFFRDKILKQLPSYHFWNLNVHIRIGKCLFNVQIYKLMIKPK